MTVHINGVAQPAPGVAVMIAAHAALTTGIHGAGALHIAGFHSAGQEVSKVIWKAAPVKVLEQAGISADVGYTDLSLNTDTSNNAKFALLQLRVPVAVIGSGNYAELKVRRNGDTPLTLPRLRLHKDGVTVADSVYCSVVVGLDGSQVIEWSVDIDTGWTVSAVIYVLGYIE